MLELSTEGFSYRCSATLRVLSRSPRSGSRDPVSTSGAHQRRQPKTEETRSETRDSFVIGMEGFDEIYRKHAGSVLRFARRCVGRKDIAEEIASEAFLELYQNRERVDAERLPAWLFTVVRNRAIDHWRRNRLEIEYLKKLEIPASSPASQESLLDGRNLKPIHRTCLILHYVYGMSRSEIAEFTGLRETQIKGYLRTGLSTLRAIFRGPPG